MTEDELKKEAEESFEKYRVTDIDYVVSPYSEDEGEKILMFNNEYDAEEEYFRLYSKGYLESAEPREKRIAELINLIHAERKRQEQCDDIHLNKIAELEKENAELKKQLEMSNKVYNDNLDYSHHIEEQLTTAKEIIDNLLYYLKSCNCERSNYAELQSDIAEAEQFLNSEVEI